MGLLIRLLILPFRRPVAAIVIGLTILGGVLAYDWDGPPTCGGSTMKQGDICHRLSDTADTYDKTYDEVESSEKSAPYIWGTLGGVLVLAGAVSWPVRRRRRAAARPAVPVTTS